MNFLKEFRFCKSKSYIHPLFQIVRRFDCFKSNCLTLTKVIENILTSTYQMNPPSHVFHGVSNEHSLM
jgi:hypothetical protein